MYQTEQIKPGQFSRDRSAGTGQLGQVIVYRTVRTGQLDRTAKTGKLEQNRQKTRQNSRHRPVVIWSNFYVLPSSCMYQLILVLN
jgi:uncharacterized cysteine cluster protein YcgN (CxxCxxCC family)